MTHEQLQAIGAALSAAGSGGAAYFGIRLLIQRGEEDCKKRFDAFREGMRITREEDTE